MSNDFLKNCNTYAGILRRYDLIDIEGIMIPVVDRQKPDNLLVSYGTAGSFDEKIVNVTRDHFSADDKDARIKTLLNSYERIYDKVNSRHGEDWANRVVEGAMARDLGYNPFEKPDLYYGHHINYGNDADIIATMKPKIYSNPNFKRVAANSDLVELARKARTPKASMSLYFIPKFSEDGTITGKFKGCALEPNLQYCNKETFEEFISLCKTLAVRVYNDADSKDALRLIKGMESAMWLLATSSPRNLNRLATFNEFMSNAYTLFGVKELPKKQIIVTGTDLGKGNNEVDNTPTDDDDNTTNTTNKSTKEEKGVEGGYVVAKEDTDKLVAAAVQATAVEIQGPVNVNYEKGKGGSVKAVITSPFDDVMDVTIVPPTDPAQ